MYVCTYVCMYVRTYAETYIHTYLSLPISMKCIFLLVQGRFLNSGGSKKHDRQRAARWFLKQPYICGDIHTYILKPPDKSKVHFAPCTRVFLEFWRVEKA